MKRTFAAACGLVFAAALAGCGSTTDSLDFKVPQGYSSKMNTFVMSMWTKGTTPGGADSVIILFKSPVKGDAKMKLDPTELTTSSGTKNLKVDSSANIQICGAHPAMLIKGTGTSERTKGKDENVEMLMTNWDGTIYMAMYAYPTTEKPDPAAEDAIKTVCEKGK